MSNDPILVLQMQRMGDLILSFPLLALLQQKYPNNPIWTVAEPRFFSELFPFSPNTVFFPPEAESKLQNASFHSVINLSHRPDAARIAGAVHANQRYGAYLHEGNTFIGGFWSLYRASIVSNNRYNLFHWSNLQLLDHLTSATVPHLHSGQATPKQGDKVGIFIGASEKEKRPNPEFFGELARILVRKKLRPFFLGGPDEVALGHKAMQIAGLKGASLCGKLSITQLAEVIKEMALFITPDTGPMHLAAWVNTPVLNISLGPVNAWETGPLLPGNYVLKPRMTCTGCWSCTSNSHRCHEKIRPAVVAQLVQTLIRDPNRLVDLSLTGIELLKTGVDSRGLYRLTPIATTHVAATTRWQLASFWQEWFWAKGMGTNIAQSSALHELGQLYPQVVHKMQYAVLHLGRNLRKHMSSIQKGGSPTLAPDFWKSIPQVLQPFSGFLHLYLQNHNYDKVTWSNVLNDVESISAALLHNN